MLSGTENSRNFQFPGKGQPPELEDDQNFRNELFEISVPFDSVPEFPESLSKGSHPLSLFTSKNGQSLFSCSTAFQLFF